ncbi:hypothetical protein HDU76_003865 [Blyttiomyces sp. JEL0837]|nr:hypothetical protein HDU76_003865 [Blyttiomyces sp. JEL0837]
MGNKKKQNQEQQQDEADSDLSNIISPPSIKTTKPSKQDGSQATFSNANDIDIAIRDYDEALKAFQPAAAGNPNPVLTGLFKECYFGNFNKIEKDIKPAECEARIGGPKLNLTPLMVTMIGAKDQPVQSQSQLTSGGGKKSKDKIDHYQCAWWLMLQGANVHAKDGLGNTALVHAVVGKSDSRTVDVAKMMIRSGASVNAKNRVGNTILHEIIRVADTLAKDSSNDAMSIESAAETSLRFLIENGADANVKNNAGEKPAEMCRNLGRPNLEKAFEKVLESARKSKEPKPQITKTVDSGLCESCGEPGTNYCISCLTVTYCSRECQKGHWNAHKEACKAALLPGGSVVEVDMKLEDPTMSGLTTSTISLNENSLKKKEGKIHSVRTCKIQYAGDFVSSEMPLYLYDQGKTFSKFISPTDPAFDRIRNIIQLKGGLTITLLDFWSVWEEGILSMFVPAGHPEGQDPRWASWNLGLFMCIRCSGVHRSMGTHISKVKSADLDTWTPEQIQNMVRWGNAKANAYWEHELPPNFEPPESNIEQWIRAKYERKQYAKKGPIPDPDDIPLPDGIAPAQLSGTVAAKKVVITPSLQQQSSSASIRSNEALVGPSSAASTPPVPQKMTAVPQQDTSSTSAAQDLFAAFQTAPVTSVNGQPAGTAALKANIMSLYTAPPQVGFGSPMQSSTGSPASPLRNTGAQPQGAEFFSQPAFANFASFPPVNAVPAAPSGPLLPAMGSAIFPPSSSQPSAASSATTATSSSNAFASFGAFNSAPMAASPASPMSPMKPSGPGGSIGGIPNFGSSFGSGGGSGVATPSSFGGNANANANSNANAGGLGGLMDFGGFGAFNSAPLAPSPAAPVASGGGLSSSSSGSFGNMVGLTPVQVGAAANSNSNGSASANLNKMDSWGDFQ